MCRVDEKGGGINFLFFSFFNRIAEIFFFVPRFIHSIVTRIEILRKI